METYFSATQMRMRLINWLKQNKQIYREFIRSIRVEFEELD